MNKKIIHTLIEQIASQSPERTAITYQDQTVSYQALNKSANQVAHTLLEKGVGRGEVVGLFLPASPDYVAGLLGVLKAGAVFMPMALDAPVKRQQQVLDKANPRWIIAHSHEAQQLPGDAQAKVLPLADCQQSACTDPDLIPAADDGNYLLFTSGSTGTPKAILGQHKSLSHFIHWEVKELGLDETVRTAFLAAPTFDVSLRDIFVPLLAGGVLCIPTPELRSQSRLLLDWIDAQQVTCLHCVPSIFRLLMQEMEAEDWDSSSLALDNVLLAGEAVYGRDVEQWRRLVHKRITLINVYGPSETTLAKLFHRADEEYLPHAMIPVGQPISNTATLILKNGQLCGIGEIGEIYIKTPFLSKGYYRDEVLTQQVFVQNPLTDEPDIIYKTGDMGRYRADRSVEFLGRQDHQVKVNGVRIELGEIEQVLMQHTAVKQAIVVARKNRDASYTLIAYYTLSDECLSADELREHAAAYLSASVLPAFFVSVEGFKLNLHGKVDRKALPEPEAMLYEHSGYVEPRNETETGLAQIWARVLALKQVGIHHTFLELGGDSLKAIRVVSHIYRDLQIQVNLKDFFQHPSVAELAEFIKGQQTTVYQAIPKVTDQPHYPCSHAQQRLWALQHMDADARAYNISGAYTLRGECNVPALEAAINQLLQRHEALRTGFINHDGQPHQQIAPANSVFRLHHQTVTDEEAQAFISKDQVKPFCLDKAPLLRVGLLTLKPDEHVLVVNIHHLICDAWSLDIMLSELFTLYRGQLDNTAVELPALSIAYKDFAAWQLAQLQENSGQQSRDWWLAHFAKIPEPLQLATDKPRPAIQTFNGAVEKVCLDVTLSNQLRQLAQQQQVSLFTLLSGLVRALLYRYSGQADFVLGTAVAGRQHPDLDNQVGLYANTLAWRDQIRADDCFNGFIQRTGQTLNDAFEHQSYPFDSLLQDLSLTQDMSRNPLFDVMVILQNAVTTELSLDNLAISAYGRERDWDSSRFDLTFHFNESADGQIVLDLNYNTDLFSATRIQSNTRHFQVLAAAVCDAQHTGTLVSQLPLMNAEERVAQLFGLNQRQQPIAGDKTLIDLFTEQVQRNPHHPALRWYDQTLTYAELDEQSSHLAQVLRQTYSLQDEERVAVSLNRGIAGTISVLACLKAGVVYVPVDPAYPAERVNYLISNSDCRLLISEAALIPGLQASVSLPGLAGIFDIDTLSGIPLETEVMAEPVIKPDQLAFVIHTSGSTGNPKGVMLEQRGFINMILDQIQHFDMQPQDGMLQFASSSFDASLYESFIALLSGATLVLIDRNTIEDTNLFTAHLDRHGVTTAVLPPVYVRALSQHPLPALRNLMTIGESAVVDDALFYAQDRQYFNGYGPSEGGICASVYKVDKNKSYRQGVPVGQATANTRIYLLDDSLQPVPQGYPGEICISGVGLARGYLNQEARTQDVFVDDPFVAGERIYRSGDLGYRDQAGELCYAGRKDDQIKMAGHRIEPAEVAYWLRQHPTVQDALVLLEAAQNTLVAYVVPESSLVAPDAVALRHYLQQHLPAWMVPARIQPLDAIPLTVNGKVDKDALPAAPVIEQGTAVSELRTEQEVLLAAVWGEILRVDAIGPTADYFELGGDSIKAIQISAQLREQGYELRVQTLFRYPVLEQAALEMAPLRRRISQDAVQGELALSPIQHWYFELNSPDPQHFNQAVILRNKDGFNQGCVKDSLETLWQHHDALRTVYQITGEGVQALNQPLSTLPPAGFECYDLRQDSRPEQACQQQVNHIHTQFDLANGPLFKAALFQLPDEERLLLVAHHLVVDGVSWRIVLDDFSTAYHLHLNQQPVVLPQKTDSYQYFTEHLSSYAQSSAIADQPYWQGVEDVRGDRLPVSVSDKANVSAQGMASVQAVLSVEETLDLRLQAHQAYNTHTDELLLAALAVCLQQAYGISSTKLAVENHGRQDMAGELDVSRTVGWFTALYPFLLELPEADPGYQIKFIKEAFRSIPQQGFDYGVLKYIARSLDCADESPQQIFNYLGEFEQGAANELWTPDLENVGEVVSAAMPRQYTLEWLAYVSDGQLSLSLTYDTASYSEDAAGKLLAHYVTTLQELIRHCLQQGDTDFSPSDLTFSDLTLEELDAVLEAN